MTKRFGYKINDLGLNFGELGPDGHTLSAVWYTKRIGYMKEEARQLAIDRAELMAKALNDLHALPHPVKSPKETRHV